MSDHIPTTAEAMAARILELDLVGPEQMDQVSSELGGTSGPLESFLAALLRRELLTRYQVERLLRGERYGFFYGRSKVLYQVGAGSFARVFRAVDRDSGAILAVKVLRNRYSNDAIRCAAFQREGMTGRLLDHPHIVKIADVGQEHGFSFITMEFIQGQNLRELIRLRGALDVRRGLELVRQVALALEYAHGKGVTHRDLKASNVLVSSAGEAKLVDFGLAGVAGVTDKTLGAEQPRTIDYATLEKVSGTRNDAVRCDIYFLGTLAYLTLSGSSALRESRDRAVRSDPQRFLSVTPLGEAAPRLPRSVANVVAQMMHLDPTQRFQTAADVRKALDTLIAQAGDDEQPAAEPRAVPRPTEEQPTTPVKATSAAAPAEAPAAAMRAAPGTRREPTLMLVEKSRKSQESLRRFLQNLGYRVLLTENPRRALTRFASRPLPADCLVISAQELGEEAVEAFNQLSQDAFLADVPAILIASPKQEAVLGAARFDDRRRLLQIPIDSDEMVSLLAMLVRSTPSGTVAAG